MLLYIIIIILGVLVDQLSKYYVVKDLMGIGSYPLIENVFHLTYCENTGAAFSALSGKQGFLIGFTILMVIVVLGLFFCIPKIKKYTVANLGLSLIASGAIGNLIDRIRLNYVVDFFDFRLIGFAIFNMADCFVVIGCGLMVYAIWFNKIPQHKEDFHFLNRKKA